MATLKEYHKKRRFNQTPEPEGRVRAGADRVFVVQKHAATRLHYDLRLEVDGVLKSWAVPKGPSLNPADKRLAVQVEDHPFEYRTFEGSIPKGQYGGGEVIVWDQGTYSPEGAMSTQQQLERGELKFQLQGEKLRGSFVLVRIKRSEGKKEWLLIKHRDAFADAHWDAEKHAESVVTGRTLQDIAEGREGEGPATKMGPEALSGAVKARMPVMPRGVPVTLAQLREKPFSDPNWLFEIKWDGVRTLAQVQNGKVTLWARSGRDVTPEYPELQVLPKYFRAAELIVDGEIVTLDEDGRSNFHRLQNRLGAQNPSQKLLQSIPATYYVFDILYADGYDLRKAPLIERKELLKSLLAADDQVRYSEHVLEQGKELFEAAAKKGLEGIIAKVIDSSYPGSRTSSWLKLKIVKELDAVIAGYTAPRRSRKYFGALVLGLYEGDELKFIGNVGTGFDESTLKEIFETLQELRSPQSPFKEIPKIAEEVQWLKPKLVARVKYGNWTDDNHLRVPVFLSVRHDVSPTECTFEGEKPSNIEESPGPPATKASASKQKGIPRSSEKPRQTLDEQAAELRDGKSETLDVESDGHRLHLTNLNKIYFPKVGLRKRDLLAYYYHMADYIAPFLHDRPMVLRRYPDGVEGKTFFQKEAPSFLPDWMETTTVHSDERGGDMQYILANSRAAILYLTNLGCIDHNPWSSRAESQDTPDYVFFDLDPTPDTPFSDVLRVARGIYGMLTTIKLKCYLKTSGASGFHIFVPLKPQYSYEQVRTFAEVVGRLVAEEYPKLTTFERSVDKRPKGRILIDALQNARGKPLACVYSARAFPNATVSAPLAPEELKANISPERWNLKTMQKRMEDVGDLWKDFWKARQTLDRAIELLEAGMPKD